MFHYLDDDLFYVPNWQFKLLFPFKCSQLDFISCLYLTDNINMSRVSVLFTRDCRRPFSLWLFSVNFIHDDNRCVWGLCGGFYVNLSRNIPSHAHVTKKYSSLKNDLLFSFFKFLMFSQKEIPLAYMFRMSNFNILSKKKSFMELKIRRNESNWLRNNLKFF